MSAAATSAQSAPGHLDLYQLRDDLAKTYNPANAHERMMVTEIAQAWIRLERAHDLERRYFDGQDMLEIIRTKLAEFKAVTRSTDRSTQPAQQPPPQPEAPAATAPAAAPVHPHRE